MQPPQRINLTELKDQLIRKLGPERSKQYFDHLNRFLSLKLTKVEFDKLCLRTVGRNNISLHNQLICSILKNACTGKVSQRTHANQSRTVGNKKPSDGVPHQNGSIPVVTPCSGPPTLPNGGVLPPSPRKARTGARERRGGDRKSTFGPNGKTNSASFPSFIPQSRDISTTMESGSSSSPSLVHQQQELMKQAEDGDEVLGCDHANSKDQSESLGRKDVSSRVSFHAPIGVSYCPVSIGGARKALPLSSNSKCVSALDADGLLEMTTLRERMEQIAASRGLQGVSMDCANVLNSGLESYLKGLIMSCTELHKARSNLRPHNRVKVNPGNHVQIQSSSRPLNAMQEHEPNGPVSLLDFRVAMELNPRQLGEEWPILLEKICTHAFEK